MTVAERVRRSSSLANDERILDAAMAMLLEHGPDGFSLRDVAAAVGLSHTAVYARYDHRHELLADLWQRRCRQHLADLVATSAVDLRLSDGPPPGQSLVESAEARAALELCIAAHRVPDLDDVVPGDVGAMLRGCGLVVDDVVDPIAIGHLALLVGTALVGPVRPDVYEQCRAAPGTLAAGHTDWSGAPPMPVTVSMEQVDPCDGLEARLVLATRTVVSRSGVARATLKRIARVADCSPTALYGVYPSVQHLLLDVIRVHAIDIDAPRRASTVVGNPHVAGAALLAGWVHPATVARRRAMIEVYAAAPHDAAMLEVAVAGMQAIFDAQVAEVAGPGMHHTTRSILSMGDVLTVGVALLAEVCSPAGIDLTSVDWRPFASSMSRGFFKQASS